MPLKDHVDKVVVTGKIVHTQDFGYVFKTEGDGVRTVKLPPHVAKFFEEKGLLVP